MSDHMSEPFEASYDDGGSYEWDDRQEDRGPHILWGRVIALGVVLILAFILGRSTASGSAAPSDNQLATLRAEVEDLQEQNELLQAELDAAAASDPDPTSQPSASPTEEAEPEGTTYIVRNKDTLQGIAIDFYGDPDLDECIADANDITDPTTINPGQELFIPDEEFC
jgi:LysM repeat protein